MMCKAFVCLFNERLTPVSSESPQKSNFRIIFHRLQYTNINSLLHFFPPAQTFHRARYGTQETRFGPSAWQQERAAKHDVPWRTVQGEPRSRDRLSLPAKHTHALALESRPHRCSARRERINGPHPFYHCLSRRSQQSAVFPELAARNLGLRRRLHRAGDPPEGQGARTLLLSDGNVSRLLGVEKVRRAWDTCRVEEQASLAVTLQLA